MGQIGILGGSFDPFHYGHLSIAKTALKECGLSKVVLLPTKVQPFKLGKKRASEEDRVNMVRLIAKKNKNFIIAITARISIPKGIIHSCNILIKEKRFFLMGN